LSEYNKKPSHVQSVSKALQILELLAGENREITLTEISEKLGWPKSTAYGLLSTLRDYHFVDQSLRSGRYNLGVRLFELGHLVGRSWNIRSVALPFMHKLNRQYGEMVQLATEERGEVLYIEKIESANAIRIMSETGARLPIHCSALGKALLAQKSQAEVRRILEQTGMPRMTRHTITELNQMEQALDTIRAQGYAVDDMEIMDGLRCVAAPIRDGDGDAKYAISVSSFAGTLSGENMERVVADLVSTAGEISRLMGYLADGRQADRQQQARPPKPRR
jgi:DNA-binding IclR family transcriptional regulator